MPAKSCRSARRPGTSPGSSCPDADPEHKIDEQSADELDEGSDVQGLEDAIVPNLLQPVCAICRRRLGRAC